MKKFVMLLFFILITCAANADTVLIGAIEDYQAKNGNSFVMDRMIVPGKGLAKAKFVWNPSRNSWDMSGSIKIEDPSLFGNIEMWLKYGESPTPVEEKITIWAGGRQVEDVYFTSPAGETYDICTFEGRFEGLKLYVCEVEDLPVGQTEFGVGKYIITYTLRSGEIIERPYYLSGSYPTDLEITFPEPNATGLSLTPRIYWNSVGTSNYDFCVYDAEGNEVYNKMLNNSLSMGLSQKIRSGKLKPNTTYKVTIEAATPEINGGQMGVKKSVYFTTSN